MKKRNYLLRYAVLFTLAEVIQKNRPHTGYLAMNVVDQGFEIVINKENMKQLLTAFSLIMALLVEAKPSPTGITFDTLDWQKAKAQAESQRRLIFVDFYADWCGPCKQLSSEVFPDSSVGEYFNAHFINLSINAEKEELDFVKSQALEAYPTLAIFDASGNLLSKHVGLITPEGLIEFARLVVDREKIISSFQSDPSFKTIPDYLKLVLSETTADSASALAENFLKGKTKAELQSEEAWNIFHHYVMDYKSDVYRHVVTHPQWYAENTKEFQAGMTWFIDKMIADAVEKEEESEMILRQLENDIILVRENLKMLVFPRSYYKDAVRLSYLANKGDSTSYTTKSLEFIEHYLNGDGLRTAKAIADIFDYGTYRDPVILQKMSALLAPYLKKDKTGYVAFISGLVAQHQGDKVKQKKMLQIAVKKSSEDSFTMFSSTIDFQGGKNILSPWDLTITVPGPK